MRVFDESMHRERERTFLLGWAPTERDLGHVELEMDELGDLARTAGAEVVGSDVQRRPRVDPTLFFGKGKVAELRTLRESLDYGLLITNDELSPRQQRGLEQELEVPVVDRTSLILDIFAQHARSREGRIQVEVAQLQHLLPRLTGSSGLSRLGGGIGTRGPGEQKLETDRRRIRNRLRLLQKELSELHLERALHREGSRRQPFRTAALVGYTNAGKSTLLNAMTAGGALVENQLFATLDPTTRAVRLPFGQPCLLVDTVGFIQKLPHELVAAFHATLEEVGEADLLVHVLDASHAGAETRLETVHTTLRELDLHDRPVLLAINKVDRCSPESRMRLQTFRPDSYLGVVLVSGSTGEGLDALRCAIADALSRDMLAVEATIPYDNWQALSRWRRYGVVEGEEFASDGVHVRGRLPEALVKTLTGRSEGEGPPG
ncbi:MAG TPA: GTPase HflX [Candidatus Dormibacteraeota bacterium]|nr:GTPase HflX [Candidatus Dormibacteraeota bacterium]